MHRKWIHKFIAKVGRHFQFQAPLGIATKLPGVGEGLGDVCVVIAYFWPAHVGHNPFVNTNLTKLSMQIRRSSYHTQHGFRAKEGVMGCVNPGMFTQPRAHFFCQYLYRRDSWGGLTKTSSDQKVHTFVRPPVVRRIEVEDALRGRAAEEDVSERALKMRYTGNCL